MPTMKPARLDRPEDTARASGGWRTVLLNCDCHTFDEVERQLMKAVRCSLARARELSWQVHNTGSAVVYEGPRERCEAVASVLEDIRLRVKVGR